ncbi:MAG: Flp pilus assembly protein CpaB [Thermodesulfobacteriota bacterium]
MGNAKWMIQLGAACTLALLAGVMAFHLSRAAQAPARSAAEVKVLAAARDLPRGHRLETRDLAVLSMRAEGLPATYFTGNASSLAGRVLLTPAAAREPLSEGRLAPEEAQAGGVSALVSPGKRAIAVKGNKVLGLSGFIRPGNRVDVVATIEDDQVPGKVMTRTVLGNVLVLAAGVETGTEPGEDGKPASVDVYTLELTPEEGEKLALAATKGALNFALRNPADNATAPTPGAGIAATLGMARPGSVPGVRPAPEVKVEVLRGTESTVQRFARRGGES